MNPEVAKQNRRQWMWTTSGRAAGRAVGAAIGGAVIMAMIIGGYV